MRTLLLIFFSLPLFLYAQPKIKLKSGEIFDAHNRWVMDDSLKFYQVKKQSSTSRTKGIKRYEYEQPKMVAFSEIEYFFDEKEGSLHFPCRSWIRDRKPDYELLNYIFLSDLKIMNKAECTTYGDATHTWSSCTYYLCIGKRDSLDVECVAQTGLINKKAKEHYKSVLEKYFPEVNIDSVFANNESVSFSTVKSFLIDQAIIRSKQLPNDKKAKIVVYNNDKRNPDDVEFELAGENYRVPKLSFLEIEASDIYTSCVRFSDDPSVTYFATGVLEHPRYYEIKKETDYNIGKSHYKLEFRDSNKALKAIGKMK